MRHLTMACRIKDYRVDGLAGLARLGPHRDVLCCGAMVYITSQSFTVGVSRASRVLCLAYMFPLG